MKRDLRLFDAGVPGGAPKRGSRVLEECAVEARGGETAWGRCVCVR